MAKPIINSFDQITPLTIQQYERYLPTGFDESLSILQKMNKVIQHLNEIGEVSNNVIVQWNEVMKWTMDEGLAESVDNKLDQMTTDGTLATIINEEVFGEINDNINNIIDHESISPDAYTGTDTQKVQKAIDDATILRRAIKLDRIYDLELSTLVINNPDGINRKPIYFFGKNGGGLQKNVAGYMFTAIDNDHGDLFFENVIFNSIAGVGTKVFNNNRLLRINTSNCFFKNVDTVLEALDPDRYLQSIRMSGDTIIGGKGFVLDFNGCYDIRLDKLVVEIREGFLNHRNLGEHKFITSSSIQNCVIEGLTGITAIFGNIKGLDLSENYFELNYKNIEFLPNSEIIGFNISNNGLYGDLIASDCFIKWAGTIYGAKSENNICGNFPLHDTTGVTSGNILSINDGYSTQLFKNVDQNKRLIIMRENNYKTFTNAVDGLDGATSDFGYFRRLVSLAPSFTLEAGEQRLVSIPFNENLCWDDSISVQPMLGSVNDKITICSVSKSLKNAWVIVRNDESTQKTINGIYVTVLKGLFSTTG